MLTQKRFNHSDSVAYLAESVVATFVDLKLNETHTTKDITGVLDGVHLYARETITLGLLWHGFYDATKEGAGAKILEISPNSVQINKPLQLWKGGCKPLVAAPVHPVKKKSCTGSVVMVCEHERSSCLQHAMWFIYGTLK